MPLPQQLDDDATIIPAEGSNADGWAHLIEVDPDLQPYGTFTVDSDSGADFQIDFSHANDAPPATPYVLVTLAPEAIRAITTQFVRLNIVESDVFKGTFATQRLWVKTR